MLEVVLNEIYWYNCIGKSKKHKGNLWMIAVVPRAGTWIETEWRFVELEGLLVVPRAGTWIETPNLRQYRPEIPSFPVRERGLKLG